jgi:hypothetical protein
MAKLTKKQKAVTVDTVKLHAIDEAIALARSGATSKFDETIEVALNLGVDPRHADQMVRGVVTRRCGRPDGDHPGWHDRFRSLHRDPGHDGHRRSSR